jgi:hypothetical protein
MRAEFACVLEELGLGEWLQVILHARKETPVLVHALLALLKVAPRLSGDPDARRVGENSNIEHNRTMK